MSRPTHSNRLNDPAADKRAVSTQAASPDPQTLDKLRQRYERMRDEKTRAETTLDNAQKQLEELQQQAMESFGTHSIDALKQRLEEMRSDNLRKRTEYQQSLDGIEASLDDIEKSLDREVHG